MSTQRASDPLELVLALIPSLSKKDRERVVKELGPVGELSRAAVKAGAELMGLPERKVEVVREYRPPAPRHETCKTHGHRFREFAHPRRPTWWERVLGTTPPRTYCERCGLQN